MKTQEARRRTQPRKRSKPVLETNITAVNEEKEFVSYSTGELTRLGGGHKERRTWEQIKATMSGTLKR